MDCSLSEGCIYGSQTRYLAQGEGGGWIATNEPQQTDIVEMISCSLKQVHSELMLIEMMVYLCVGRAEMFPTALGPTERRHPSHVEHSRI